MRKSVAISLLCASIVALSSFSPEFISIENRKLENVKSANTCIQVWNILVAECFDTGGNYGLVNDKTPLATAWTNLKNASDAKFDGSKVTDGLGNIYVQYTPSSTATFQGKGYTIVGGLAISAGPNCTQKIRFTK